ncbi:MAG: hypothetical protein DRP29_00590 [Thermodesulfobacteriota bacterium]|nr:MAG: hypothetical protein DRP29_00590 [Thermodesulfobacteriota bacterium]
MFPQDVRLWERFLAIYGDQFERFEYDVKVGRGIEPPPDLDEPYRSAAVILSKKRIDAVGYKGSEIWIFEVKPDIGLAALGQLLAYRELWIRDRGDKDRLRLAAVTDNIIDDERYVYEKFGIKIYLV